MDTGDAAAGGGEDGEPHRLRNKGEAKNKDLFLVLFFVGGVVCLFVLITNGKKRTLILSVSSALSSV